MAAFLAPPTATVATGMPLGICTVLSSASSPPRPPEATGTPMTGSTVLAATAPARCAAMPARAITAPTPSPSSDSVKSLASWGVRWALSTRTMACTPYCASVFTASMATGLSLALPITMATFFMSVLR